MDLKDTNKDFKPIYFSKSTNTSSPAFIGEKRILYFDRNDIKEALNKVIETLTVFSMKVPSSLARSSVTTILSKNAIYLGRDIDGGRTGIIGRPLITSGDKLAGILLEISNLDIDIITGDMGSIDNTFYSIYFLYIRSIVLAFKTEIRNDINLLNNCSEVLYFLLLRSLGNNLSFGEKEKIILRIISEYYFNRFMLYEQHPLSMSKALSVVTDESRKKEFETKVNNFKKYESFKDIFKAMADLGLIHDNPNSYIYILLQKLKPLGFHSMSTTLDYFIALIIVTLYPFNLIGINNFMPKLQSEIEKIVINNYGKNMKYNIIL